VPRLTLAQLVLVELAAAAAAGGYAERHAWLIAGAAVAVGLLALAVIPVQRRWLYQLAMSWFGLVRRRQGGARRSGGGLAGVLGSYTIESVPASSALGADASASIGVVRSGTTWCLPLVLALDAVFNDDAPVPVQLLSGLLQVEDVTLSSVRLFTLTMPARSPQDAPAGPAAPLTPLAARYCLLTLDTRRCADAIAARGGTEAAVHQILRRCTVHAEQVLASAGLRVRRLGAPAVESLFSTWMGPADAPSGRRGGQAIESWGDVRVAGTWSTVFAVTGSGPDVTERVSRLAAAAPTPVVATSLVLQHAIGTGGATTSDIDATMLVRLSAPDSAPRGDVARSLNLLARAYDLVMQRMGGEQGILLRATTPVGVGDPT
jgi:type VII secretion protein EccE